MGKGSQPLPSAAGQRGGMGSSRGSSPSVATLRSRCAVLARGNAPIAVMGNSLPVEFLAVLLSLTPEWWSHSMNASIHRVSPFFFFIES